MKKKAVTDALSRQFLLARMEHEERRRIETLFLTDSHMRKRVIAAEQELIDDYLEDRLSTLDRERFLSLYAQTAAQRRNLWIAKSLYEWACRPRRDPAVYQVSYPTENCLRWPGIRLALVIPVAIAATIMMVIALVWVNSRRTERFTEYLAMQHELIRLNSSSSLRDDLPPMMLLMLKPGSLRNGESQSELKRAPNSTVAELRLLWTQTKNYPTYQAVARWSGDDSSYTIPNLTAENEDAKFIRLRLPARLLTHGDHEIELTGVAADGSKSPTERYSFTVSKYRP